MGIFDFLKKKTGSYDSLITRSEVNSPQVKKSRVERNLAPYFGDLTIPENIRDLLWFADGQYKNYNPEADKRVVENELFRIEYFFGTEPSLIYSNLPISKKDKTDPKEKIGYYPSYEKLSPEERRTYLEWLRDVTQPVDIGYVFIFYYGLERHLIFGKYREALDMILLLREHHKNSSFYSYSGSALIMASILHRDKEMFEKVVKNLENGQCDSIMLIAKYLLKEDLSIDEIISLSSKAGFNNKRYMNGYPDLFRQNVTSMLEAEFGRCSLPFYNLYTKFALEKELIFANFSFSEETRTQTLPSIISNAEFKSLIYNLLSSAHEAVKKNLEEQRKAGIKPEPATRSRSDTEKAENNTQASCPYCEAFIKDVPKKKKKCPACGNYIYVRTKQNLFPSTLLTEDDALAVDEFEKLKAHGITPKDFTNEKNRLSREKNTKVISINVCLSLYDELLLRTTDLSLLKFLYFEMSLFLYNTGGDFFKPLQMSAKIELMAYQQKGIERVFVFTGGDASCPECQKLSGRVYTIDEALREKPIPCKACIHKLHDGREGWCRCQYMPQH